MKHVGTLLWCFLMLSQSLFAFDTPIAAKVKMDPLGNIVAVWEEVQAGVTTIQAANYVASTLTWSAPQQLSTVGLKSRWPLVAVNASGEAVAIWESTDTVFNIDRVYAATIVLQDPIPTWTANTVISPNTQRVISRSIDLEVADNHSAVITWTADVFSPSKIGIFVSVSSAGGLLTNTWDPEIEID